VHTRVCDTLVCMAVDRLSITVDAELGQAVRQAAAAEGVSVSSWASEALADRVRRHSLRTFLDEWEAEAGPISEEDKAEAKRIFAEAKALAEAKAERLAG
jgi:post-segregation antitoxin (ccd killing protein)